MNNDTRTAVSAVLAGAKRTALRLWNIALFLCAVVAGIALYVFIAGPPTAKGVADSFLIFVGPFALWLLVFFPFGELAELIRERHADRRKIESAIWSLQAEVQQLREYIAMKTNVTPDKVRFDWPCHKEDQ